MSFSITVKPASVFTRMMSDVGELVRLAWPVIMTRSGVVLMALVDTIMVGQYGSLDLAYLSIGLALFGPMLVAGVGIAMGTQVITAMTFGEGRLSDCGAVWQRGAPFAFVIGLAGLVLCLFGEAGLLASSQTPDIAREGGRILAILGIGLPFVLFFISSGLWLEGLKRPMPGVCFMLAANVVNLFFNWALIFGNAGFPELGAEGSAWSTTMIRIALAIGIAIYIWWLPDRSAFGVRQKPAGGWKDWKNQRRIGYSASLSIGGESLGFGALGILIGRLGPLALGAHAILFNMMVFTAMIAIGISSATSVRVGIAHGGQQYFRTWLATVSGLMFATLAAGATGASFYLFSGIYADLYTSDPVLNSFVQPLIVLLAAVVILDANRIVMNSALRGRGETWLLAICNMSAFLVLMVPLATWLGAGLKFGLKGVYLAVLIACIVSLVLLLSRFLWLSHRDPDDALAP